MYMEMWCMVQASCAVKFLIHLNTSKNFSQMGHVSCQKKMGMLKEFVEICVKEAIGIVNKA